MFSKNRLFQILGVLAILFSFLLSACGQAAVPGGAPEAEPVTLRIALLPVLDALPIYVAQSEGLFSQHGVAVEFIPVSSAPERDQIVAAGQADGMVNEVLSTMFYNRDEVQVLTVRYAQAATSENALFRILAAGSSGITTPEGLKNVDIGVSQGTVIEYLTDRLLQAEGFSESEIATIAVPKITDRMALLSSGELKAAMLPEPLSSLAVSQGAVVALDDTSHPEYSFSVISFRKQVVDENPEAIRGFLAAVEEATQKINTDPQQYKALLVERELIPAPLVESFRVAPFVTAGVPTQSQWQDVLEWAQAEGLLDKDLSYTDSVDPSYLP